jgi:hypothetical protein
MPKGKKTANPAVHRRTLPPQETASAETKEETSMSDTANNVVVPELTSTNGPATEITMQTIPEAQAVKAVSKDPKMSERMLRQRMLERFKAQDKVPIIIPPMYRPYVGNVMPIQINGISVYVKANGEKHMVPRQFADIWEERRMYIDSIVLKEQGMADVSNNAERRPGEISLF